MRSFMGTPEIIHIRIHCEPKFSVESRGLDVPPSRLNPAIRAVELCVRSRGEHRRWAASRHGERERAPAADSIAVSVDVAAVRLDESFGNGQPDTGSAVLTVARPVDSVKAVEQSDQVRRGNTVPV